MLLREVTPKEGNVYFNNEIISAPGFRKVEKLRQNIGTIFQDFKIVPDRNALENLLISLDILKTKNAKEVAMKSLKEVGLEKKAFFFPIQLSAGELQRLAIARAVTGGRQVIIADEPTGNLDPITAWEIIRLFNKIHKKDTTIIFATHNSEIVNTLKKRVIVMKKGRVSRDIAQGEYSLEQ